jgi:hypothetical protein
VSSISDHFTWAEATTTSTGLPNEPDPAASAALAHTFSEMERVRAKLGGRAITVHSAYRSPAVNAAVGGVETSQHRRGEAVDFHVAGLSVPETVKLLAASDLPFDQLIEEAQTWVHISFTSRRAPRRQALTMRIVDGRKQYTPFVAA